jgi:hypothetical protein
MKVRNMKSSRTDVVAAILGEREYQDAGRGNAVQNSIEQNGVAGSLLAIEAYLNLAKHALMYPLDKSSDNVLSIVRKITALGFRCMEVNGAIERE